MAEKISSGVLWGDFFPTLTIQTAENEVLESASFCHNLDGFPTFWGQAMFHTKNHNIFLPTTVT